ncbi:MAG TPA: tetratricopeptide repeat protein [Candidatus Acidoferrum sp.]|nr:tetratricopeptide repeat protein [Candidatus Acidoferrum sp.]
MRLVVRGIFCLMGVVVCAAVVTAQAPPSSGQNAGQAPAGPTAPAVTPRLRPAATVPLAQNAVGVDGSEAMFTTMCALLAAGYEADVSADHWSPYRAQMRERLQAQQGPAVEALRQFYREHQLNDPAAMLSRYLWFGLVSGPAPKFTPVLRRDELPPEILVLEGFSEILSAYYREQQIGRLWRQVQPVYAREIERLHDEVSQIVFVSSGYLRDIVDGNGPRTFMIVVEPLVGRITNVRNWGDHYAIVLSGGDDLPTDLVRHAFLHFLLDPLPLEYPHVVATKRALFERAAQAPRLEPELRDDLPSYVAECLVRAVEIKLKKASPGEREAALERADVDGYVMVRPLFEGLVKFEGSEPAMTQYFPDLIRGIDLGAESKRLAALQFAPERSKQEGAALSTEEVARRRALQPTTLPSDPDVIADLTEGERKIAEKDPRAAEAAFQKVLAKYPDQVRAWYGLGMVAVLDHDAARAKEVFARLTSGDHAATQDPMVMAWSHIYLGRIYDGEGQAEVAKSQFEAALSVHGLPERARDAAQQGLDVVNTEKPAARP